MVLFESLEKKIETPDALLIDVALPVDFSELFYMEAILDIELVLDCQWILVSCFILHV